MPFERNVDNIEYKTDDFETFTLSQIKREGEEWIGVEKPKNKLESLVKSHKTFLILYNAYKKHHHAKP